MTKNEKMESKLLKIASALCLMAIGVWVLCDGIVGLWDKDFAVIKRIGLMGMAGVLFLLCSALSYFIIKAKLD